MGGLNKRGGNPKNNDANIQKVKRRKGTDNHGHRLILDSYYNKHAGCSCNLHSDSVPNKDRAGPNPNGQEKHPSQRMSRFASQIHQS
jgi:hypothetical protein